MAPDKNPLVSSGPTSEVPQYGAGPEGSDPRKMTPRERRRRSILLAFLLLLLLLLSYFTYYYIQNRRLPTIGLAPAGSDYVPPPRYLYSIVGDGASEMYRPVGVGVAEDRRVYVVDFGNSRVSVFTNPGRYLFSFSKTADGTLENPVHLAIKDDEVWVSDRRFRKLYIFDLEGNYKREYKPKDSELNWTPMAFSFDTTGSLRATDVGNTDLHRLLYFSEEGSLTAQVGKTGQVGSVEEAPGDFYFPNGVAIAKNGDVYVSDGDNRRVQVFDARGEFVRFIDTSGVPRGIAIDAKQRVYVADALAHSIDVYDLKGAKITSFGERGFGPGQFNYPNDVAIDDRDRIYISDRENDQVQVWGWPVAEPPALPALKSSWWPLLLLPLLLLPLLLLRRRSVRLVVTPDFIEGLERFEEIKNVSENGRVRLIAPREDRSIYEGREVEGVLLTDLLTFEDYSESDAQTLMDRLRIDHRSGMLLAMAERAKGLATEDYELRRLAIVAEVRSIDIREFREMFLNRD